MLLGVKSNYLLLLFSFVFLFLQKMAAFSTFNFVELIRLKKMNRGHCWLDVRGYRDYKQLLVGTKTRKNVHNSKPLQISKDKKIK